MSYIAAPPELPLWMHLAFTALIIYAMHKMRPDNDNDE